MRKYLGNSQIKKLQIYEEKNQENNVNSSKKA